MESNSLPSASRLRWRFAFYGLSAATMTLMGFALCVSLMLDLEAADMPIFGFSLSAVGLMAATGFGVWGRRALDPIADWLAAQAGDEVAMSPTLKAFSAVIALPVDAQRVFTIAGCCTAIGVPLVLTILDGPSWGVTSRSIVLVVGGVSAAMLSGIALFFGLKRELEPVRRNIATRIHDPEERRSRIHPVSISRKLSTAVVGTVAAAVIFVVALSSVQTGAAVDKIVLQTQVMALDAVVAEIPGSSFKQAVRGVLRDRKLLPFPIHFEMIEAKFSAVGTDEFGRIRQKIRVSVANGNRSGVFDKAYQDALWAFRTLPEGGIVVSRIQRSDVALASDSRLPALFLMLAVSMGCAFMISRMISSDLRGSLTSLREAVETMASGDLQRGQIYESEDEFGDLSRSFEVMGGVLRATVESLSAAADEVDTTAENVARVAEGVAESSAEQVRRIQEASELMVSINKQVMDVAGSAQDLNISVEESSSSILELGAAGDELNETATVLGSKVDEVSSSIEQMVRSVKEVGSSSNALTNAAAETSASMEEMASAMRAVDTTAEMTAELSRDVIASAESGQQKVSQTIEGMQEIRDATDTAENVIRGLGARTQEIGAILDVIDDVAEETNLLALNAAIIAAQAGEHGRAFSVVAEEIKELADRVLASTKEIGGLIRGVQDESDNAVGAIEVGIRSVASGVELSAEAGVSLEEITSSSRESGRRIGEIVAAVREQTTAASHVVALMDTVREGVEAIVRASADQDRGNETIYRSSITMREVAQQVRRTTEEQSRGFGRIRESIEGVREVVENINGSLHEQSTACSQVVNILEQVFERTRSNEAAAQSMGDSITGLVSQAQGLREQVAKFQI